MLTVYLHNRVAVVMTDTDQLVIEVSSETAHMTVDVGNANLLQRIEPVSKTGDAKEVDRTILEARAGTILRSQQDPQTTWNALWWYNSLAVCTVPPPQYNLRRSFTCAFRMSRAPVPVG